MQFKTDTKEKFHAITLTGPLLSATMTAQLVNELSLLLQIGASPDPSVTRNVVLNMSEVEIIDNDSAIALATIQQKFYEHSASFVICGLHPGVEQFLDQLELLEVMNVTPTESEAWDIVQMEEIERELLDGE